MTTMAIALIVLATYVLGLHTKTTISGSEQNYIGNRVYVNVGRRASHHNLPRPLFVGPPSNLSATRPELHNGIGDHIRVFTYADNEDHPEAQRLRKTCSSRLQVR